MIAVISVVFLAAGRSIDERGAGLAFHRFIIRYDSCSLFNDDDLIGLNSLERFVETAGPANLEIRGQFRA